MCNMACPPPHMRCQIFFVQYSTTIITFTIAKILELGTATIERSFGQMKIRFRNRFTETWHTLQGLQGTNT